MTKAVIQLEQVTCPSCIKKIETALNKLPGVAAVEMLFHSSKVKTQFDETIVNADKLVNTINKLGYSVMSTKLI